MGWVLCKQLKEEWMEELDSLHMKDTITKAMTFTGDALTLATLPLPLNIPSVVYLSTGSLESTMKHYSKVNLFCTALSSYGWLTYSVLQVSFKDHEEIIGIDAIFVNAFSWIFTGLMLLVLLSREWQSKRMVCILGLIVYIILTIAPLQFLIFKWVDKKSREKLIFGVIAASFHALAEFIPIIKLVIMWLKPAPEGGYPQVQNYKKFIIISRALDSLTTVFWMIYCVFTYEFDVFGIASIVCAGLSIISLCAHSAWAVKPN